MQYLGKNGRQTLFNVTSNPTAVNIEQPVFAVVHTANVELRPSAAYDTSPVTTPYPDIFIRREPLSVKCITSKQHLQANKSPPTDLLWSWSNCLYIFTQWANYFRSEVDAIGWLYLVVFFFNTQLLYSIYMQSYS